MSDAFDPYYIWLGIPPEDQPPHHYQLLGIDLFEGDGKTIAHAALSRTETLRTYQLGSHFEASQTLLNQVAQAKVCLLDAEKKAAYDAELERRLSPVEAPAPTATDPAEIQRPQPTTEEVADLDSLPKVEQEPGSREDAEQEEPTFPSTLPDFDAERQTVRRTAGRKRTGTKRAASRRRGSAKRKGRTRAGQDTEEQDSNGTAISPAAKIGLPVAVGAVVLLLIWLIVFSITSTPESQVIYHQDFSGQDTLDDFQFSDPTAWRLGKNEEGEDYLELFRKSQYTPLHTSPYSIALLTDKQVKDFVLDVELQQTGIEYSHRDMCIFSSFVNPAHYYYAHIASIADDRAHNIFIVDNQPRKKLSRNTTEGHKWSHDGWHDVRIKREGNTIMVFVDDMETPIMEASDGTLGWGYVGIGSFDDTGRIRKLTLSAPKFREGNKKKQHFKSGINNNKDRTALTPEIPDWGEKEEARNKAKPSKPKAAVTPAPLTPAEAELSEEEKARLQLTKTYKLEEEDFSHTWHLVNEQTRNLEALETSGSSGTTGGADFEAELKHRVEAKKKEIMDRWIWISQQPAGNPQLDAEYHHLMTIVRLGYSAEARYVRDNIHEITSIRTQVEQEFASRGPATVDPGMVKLIKDIHARYAELAQNVEVIDLLEKAGGTLAKPPILPEPASDKPEQPISLPADDADAPQDDVASAEEPASAEEGGETEAEETPQEPAASFAELKDQLTALEKKTKLSLGSFNKGAKEYTKQKKDLVKRIKSGEALYARRAKIQDGIQYPEDKTKFGQETDAKVTKPLQALKVQLQKLSKPDAAAMEDNLSRAEKLLAQIKATPEYAANQKSIDGRAENIAKYHKGFNVQQVKMAK